MKNTFLSHFTPSLMTSETLEAILVQRHQLADELVEAINESVLTANKHFRLLVGARGIGKTHMVALIYHRIFNMTDLRDKLLIAWLREEEWGITSFLDLLLRIFRALKEDSADYDSRLSQKVESLYQLTANEAEYKAAELLREFVGERTLLLLMENLNDLFDGLGDIGQKQFRAYIQNYSFITILATSQNLFDGVKLKSYPFYGFFYTHHLEELKLDEAVNLLRQIAQLEGNRELECFIQTLRGLKRIQSIHHLAGGNPRVYVIFSQFLSTSDSLDELVEPFMQMLDDLTPYYQNRMQWLSPQQRKIVELLIECRHPITVKEIAQRCFITHQTASSQLKDLKEKGYLTSETIGRESFYELREVLMRFCLEVKKQRGEPIRLFVDFLRFWYTKKELQQRLKMLPLDAELERTYVVCALNATRKKIEDPRVPILFNEYKSHIVEKEFVCALEVSNKLVEIRGHAWDWVNRGYCLHEIGHYEEALASYNKAIELNPNNSTAWFNRGVALDKLERDEEALASYDKAIELDPDYATAWLNQAWELSQVGRYEEALLLYNQAVKFDSQDARSWKHRGWVLSKLRQYSEALASCKQAIQLNPNDAAAWKNQGWVLSKLDHYEEALASCKQAIQLNPNDAAAWKNQGWVLNKLKNYEESLHSWSRAIDLKPHDATAWSNQGRVLEKLERYNEALTSYNQAIECDPDYPRLWNDRGWVLEHLRRYEEALESWAMAVELNPEYVIAWNNQSWLLRHLGRYEKALRYYNKAIEVGEQSSHVFFNRAEVLLALNLWDESIAALDSALNRFAHADEPDTGNTKEIVGNVFRSSQDTAIWKSRITTVVDIYDKHQVTPVLGQGIVQSIPTLMSEMVSNKAALTWLEVWHKLVGDRPEFQIPLRLLGVAVRYRQTKGDRRVLLELPIEERTLLQPLLEGVA